MSLEEEQLANRKDLKIQALLEKISSLTTNYESMCADYRVEITIAGQEIERLKIENEFLASQVPKDEEEPAEEDD